MRISAVLTCFTHARCATFTFNTDFAETEVDQQRVNLSRFLSLPEKRDFFLEGSDQFSFGAWKKPLAFSRPLDFPGTDQN